MPSLGSCGRGADAAIGKDLLGVALLDRNLAAGFDVQIHRGGGCRHIERQSMDVGEDRNRVGPNLIGYVSTSSNAVRSDDARVDLSTSHQVAGHTIRDHRVWDLLLRKLPRGKSRSLQKGPSLIDIHVQLLPSSVGRPYHP